MANILQLFLTKNNFDIDKGKEISLQLKGYPGNLSFRAITDTLDYFGIINMALTVPENALQDLPNNFITTIKSDIEQVVLAVKGLNSVSTYDENGKKNILSISDFKKIWGKQIVVLEEQQKNRRQEFIKSILFIVPVLIFIAFLSAKKIDFVEGVIIFLSIVGLFTSFIITRKSLGYSSSIIQSFCTSSLKSSCSEILNSKTSLVFGKVLISDICILFFTLLSIQSIFFKVNDITYILLLLSLPIVFYLIFHQAIMAKKYCPLCLVISITIICLNGTFFFTDGFLGISVLEIFELFFILVLLIPIYFYQKNIIVTKKINQEELDMARKFKRSPKIVKLLMNDNNKIINNQKFENEIVLGKNEAKNKIIAFTNPLCGYCEAAFKSYINILSINSNVKFYIRFNGNINDENSLVTKISLRLIEIAQNEGSTQFINAYLSWFEVHDFKFWFEKFGEPRLSKDAVILLEEHRNWGRYNLIDYTPTTIIQDKVFPTIYDYSDLLYVFNYIIDYQNDKTNFMTA